MKAQGFKYGDVVDWYTKNGSSVAKTAAHFGIARQIVQECIDVAKSFFEPETKWRLPVPPLKRNVQGRRKVAIKSIVEVMMWYDQHGCNATKTARRFGLSRQTIHNYINLRRVFTRKEKSQ